MHRSLRAPLVLALLAGCASAPSGHDGLAASTSAPPALADASPPPPPAGGRLPSSARPTAYALELVVDPRAEGFVGAVDISVELAAPQRWIWLHAKDLTIDQATSSVTDRDLVTRAFPEQGLLAVDLGREIPAGALSLRFAYHAKYASGLSGLYEVDAGGDAYAFTQFEATDARRAFPCFDEPRFKTPFDVSVVAPEGQVVVGNTQTKSEEKLAGGKKRVTLARTEKLPTYLVALAVGPLDVVSVDPIPPSEARKAAIPLRGVAARGQGKKLAYALAETRALVLELERYFGIAYPYDKLDMIAVPDFPAGAMENAGAVTFQERLLLVDPTTGTEPQRRDVTGVMAHELAHQWFGNLVTMAWWDDLWLNEAFATWMGQRVVERLHPTWETDLETLAWMHSAMDSDSLASARAIRQPIASEDDIENAFDDLTYEKGGGLIAMYERFLGEERFRAGVRRYLDEHRFGSATTQDFLAAVFEGQPKELPASFEGFLNAPGVPSIAVGACTAASPAKVALDVGRWLPLGSSAKRQFDAGVPLCVRTDGAQPVCQLASAGQTQVALGAKCPKWTFPNADGAAYARWTPGASEVDTLLGTAWKGLTAREKMSAVDALRSGVRAGTLDAGVYVGALGVIARDPARSVAFAPIEDLAFLRDEVLAPADRPKLERRVREAYAPLFAKAGWTPKAGAADTPVLRHDALEAATSIGRDPKLRAEALRRAKAFLGVGGTPDRAALAPELVDVALAIAVQDGGVEVWEAVRKTLAATDDAQARRNLIEALMVAPAPLAERSRALVLDGTIRGGELYFALRLLLSEPETKDAAWSWLVANLGELGRRMPESQRGYLPSYAGRLCDASREAEVRRAFAPFLDAFVGAPRELENAIERVKICSAIRERQAGPLARWLSKG